MENKIFNENQSAMKKSAKQRQWKIYGLIFAAYTLYILLKIPQIYFRNMHSVYQQPWGEAIGLLALWSYLWALLTPFIIRLARRFSISRKFFLKNLLLQISFGILFASIHRAATVIFLLAFAPTSIKVPLDAVARAFYFLHFVSDGFFDYVLILVIIQAIIYFKEVQEREFRLQQAELQTLKTQLHPHFLFNTLNAVSSLVSSSPKAAQKTIAQLSDLLRLSLKDDRTHEISLKDELYFLRKYVQIQQTLLQERLEVKWNISPETLDALVPSLILQPLVENSIRHGIAPKENGGSININAVRQNGMLAFVLSDNGLGLSSDRNSDSGHGIGLTNTRTRLQYLYGDAHEFALSESPNGGVTVNMKIPFKESATDN
ncbi:MAG: histidine kinase [Acidobacteriota bacterium]|nr:histidine kinase [Acidobacteriota bacterium]